MVAFSTAFQQSPELNIQLLGGFSISQGETRLLGVDIRSRRARSLIKLLALAPEHRLHRDQVMDVLWPKAALSAATNSLHQTLYGARKALEPLALDCLTLKEGFLSLSGGADHSLIVDVDQFETAVSQAIGNQNPQLYESALSLYTGELLPTDRYEEWALHRREALKQAYLKLLFGLAGLQEADQDFSGGIETLQRLLESDPGHEEAHVALMRLYARSGRRQQALRQYQTLSDVLQAELEIEPGPAARRLYEAIQSGQFEQSAYAASFPTRSTHRHSLPAQLTPFIGREQEIAAVTGLVRNHRLVTLTGSGGVGKTRLSIRAVSELFRQFPTDFPHGIWYVELAPLSDPELVPLAVANALDLQTDPGRSILEALGHYLSTKQGLLVLDNCEHLLATCAQMVDILLRNAPTLKILISSREALGIPGERAFRVPSLSIPEADRFHTPETLQGYEAVRLFIDRVHAVLPSFRITTDNAPYVTRICQRLDGIPLAIELAAARLNLLTTEQLVSRLDNAFHLLTGGNRAALPRQQTLRGTIDWSYQLLSESERLLLCRLAVFAGEASLEGIEVVCSGDGLKPEEILDLLNSLVGKSMVDAERDPGVQTSYRLLETVRQYAHEKLLDNEEYIFIRNQHLAYYQELAEQAEQHLNYRSISWLRRLERELPNFRLALDWAQSEFASTQCLESGLRLAAKLGLFWKQRNRNIEGSQRLERMLDLVKTRQENHPLPESMSQAQAWAMLLVIVLENLVSWESPDFYVKANHYLDECRAIFGQLSVIDRRGLAWEKHTRNEVIPNADTEGQVQRLEEVYTEAKFLDDKLLMRDCLKKIAVIYSDRRKLNLAETYVQKAQMIAMEVGDLDHITTSWIQLGFIAFYQGGIQKARSCAANARDNLHAIKDDLLQTARFGFAFLHNLSWRMGDYAQAEQDSQFQIEIEEKIYPKGVGLKIRLGGFYISRGDYAKARALLNETLDEDHVEITNGYEVWSNYLLAELDWSEEKYDRAVKRYTRMQMAADAPDICKLFAEFGLARVAFSHSQCERAVDHIFRALNLQKRVEVEVYIFNSEEDNFGAVILTAILCTALRRFDSAARLLGAADYTYRINRFTYPLHRRQWIDQVIEDTRNGLDEETFKTAWEEGKVMDFHQTFEYALKMIDNIKSDLIEGKPSSLNIWTKSTTS